MSRAGVRPSPPVCVFSLIVLLVVCMFTAGMLCVLYLMLRIGRMERAGPAGAAEPALQPKPSTVTIEQQLSDCEVNV